jgi:nickel-dependent lactate racemase
VYLGDTSRSTPVYANRIFVESDFKIAIGSLEPHHFMGYSGGAKSAAIGVTGRKTINHNHAMLVHPKATFGEYVENPMRQDVEEIGDLIDIDLAINSIPNEKKGVVDIVAGSPRGVMQRGIPISQKICQVPVAHANYDLVIASAGGYPKDINLYQAQKALTHACAITRDGGVVLLVAECIEGSGSAAFEAFVRDVQTPEEVFAKMEKVGFQVGPHKAFQIARQALRVDILLLCRGIPEELTKTFFIHPVSHIQAALEFAYRKFGTGLRIAVLPSATNTIPSIP